MDMKKIDLSLLSKYRTECMGFAILFVLGVHSVDFGIVYPFFLSKALKYGQIGVNIFFLLSGMGMYYSLKRGTKGFYTKRISKILPTYFIIAVPVFFIVDILLDKEGLLVYLFDLSTLRYWMQGVGYWYVAVQIIFYLIIPLHYILNSKLGKRGWILNLLVIVCALLIGQFLKNQNIRTFGLLFERYPIFIIGFWIAKIVEKGRKFPLIGAIIAVSSIAFKSLFHLPQNHFLHNFTLALAGFGMCIILCWFLEVTQSAIKSNILSFLGKFTLEIYMMNVSITWILLRCRNIWEGVPVYIIYWMCSGLIAIVIAYLIHKIYENHKIIKG